MSNESWQTVLLIFFGVLLGGVGGLIAAPNVLPISVGEGWWNLAGAIVGVFGAFLAAWSSYVWNERARERNNAAPFTSRQEDSLKLIDECLSLLKPVWEPMRDFAEKAVQECEIHQNLVSISLPVTSKYPEIHAQQTKDIAEYTGKLREVTSEAAAKVPIDELIGAQSRLGETIETMDWLLSNMVEVMSPTQVRLLKSARDYLNQAYSCTELTKNVFVDYQKHMVRQHGKVDLLRKATLEAPAKLRIFLEKAKTQIVDSRS